MAEETKTLIKMSSDIGKLCGKIDSMHDAQKEVNRRVTVLLEKNDSRITDIEKSANRIRGFIVGTGFLSGGVGAWLAKLIS